MKNKVMKVCLQLYFIVYFFIFGVNILFLNVMEMVQYNIRKCYNVKDRLVFLEVVFYLKINKLNKINLREGYYEGI